MTTAALPHVVKQFIPAGKLRASINLGNPILAGKNGHTGEPTGVSVDLAKAFAQRLGVPLELVVFDAAGKAADALKACEVDIGFLAIDPLRAESIRFTPPYVVIEGAYLVREESRITGNEQVDQPGNRIVVGKGSAYDLYLGRVIKQAGIVRAPTSPAVVDTFVELDAEVAAGVKQQLQKDAARIPGLRLLPGRFMAINQAMGIPANRSDEALACLVDFIEEMKASGFVADALQRHGIAGAAVAAPGYPVDQQA
ncbi:ABC transporter substrate-binding protein [Noviherbaspirillum aerium]|uniref:ABC transporter substrate-binding protein n=1 Tax=Noviherbaspirillum aerium TaxID=2588497 RepID=UPI00124D2B0F|nr:ABC transporter substrate-binding protein [Noviherbaspirillum aerium]